MSILTSAKTTLGIDVATVKTVKGLSILNRSGSSLHQLNFNLSTSIKKNILNSYPAIIHPINFFAAEIRVDIKAFLQITKEFIG